MLPRITCVVTCAVVSFTTAPASHADPGVAPATLDQTTFLRLVHERSPRRRVLDERRAAAAATARATGLLPNPTLGWERESVSSIDNRDDFVRVGWSLDIAGRRGLARRAAEAEAAAERADVDGDALALELVARQAYLDAAYARAQLALLDADRTTLAEIVQVIRSRARQGESSEYDAERAALELDHIDDERATAIRTLELARLRLGELVGEPATPYDASEALVLPASPTDASTVARAEIAAARARAEAAEAERVAAGRGWVPRLQLMGGMMASRSMGQEGVGYVVGISGELPVFDRGARAAAASAAEQRRWTAEADVLQREATASADRARRDLVMRIQHAESYAAGPVRRARDLQRRVTIAYREGDRPILELLDVHRAARETATRALELVYQAREAELSLARARGGAR